MTTNGNGGTVYTIVGGGSDIGNDSDSFHYAFTNVAGDFDYIATVQDLQGLAYWAKAELMARASTNDLPSGGDPFFATMTAPSGGGNEVVSQWRASRSSWGEGASASPAYRPSYPNTWLRLKRQGNTFISLAGTNGLTWTELGRHDFTADQFPYKSSDRFGGDGVQRRGSSWRRRGVQSLRRLDARITGHQSHRHAERAYRRYRVSLSCLLRRCRRERREPRRILSSEPCPLPT